MFDPSDRLASEASLDVRQRQDVYVYTHTYSPEGYKQTKRDVVDHWKDTWRTGLIYVRLANPNEQTSGQDEKQKRPRVEEVSVGEECEDDASVRRPR